MELSIIPIWITSSVAVTGVIYTIWRNGKSATRNDESLKTELKRDISTIKDQLDDPTDGLSAIRKAVEDQRLHCARISTSLSEQVKANSDEINRLRGKRVCKDD